MVLAGAVAITAGTVAPAASAAAVSVPAITVALFILNLFPSFTRPRRRYSPLCAYARWQLSMGTGYSTPMMDMAASQPKLIAWLMHRPP